MNFFERSVHSCRMFDFAVCRQRKIKELVQVAYDISTEKSFKRETSALVSAADKCHCQNLTLIAQNEGREVLVRGKKNHRQVRNRMDAGIKPRPLLRIMELEKARTLPRLRYRSLDIHTSPQEQGHQHRRVLIHRQRTNF